MHIDLNCDMGESFGRYTLGDDSALLKIVTSANIACGFHAGDPVVMANTVQQAIKNGVAVGAHPGYPDLQGFGRRSMALSPREITTFVLYQMSALAGFARVSNSKISHVKPHGALYNQAAQDKDIAEAIVDAVLKYDKSLILVTLPNSILCKIAQSAGLRVAAEGFVDRAYRDDGSLVPRSQPGAVIHDLEQVVERAVRMVTQREIKTYSGHYLHLEVDTLCIHGDTPGATRIAKRVRKALEDAGVKLCSLPNVTSEKNQN